MASSRSRRSNAGSKMAMLLNSMESEEFYSTTYGGFDEEDADVDFVCEAAPVTATTTADIDDDIVDSDFSIDENDEPRSDVENEDDPDRPKRAKRALGVQTKAYKEPKRDQPKPKRTATVPTASTVKPEKAAPKPKPRPTPSGSEFGRKLTRASTVSKTVETVKRQRERALKAKRLLKKKLSLKSSTNSTRPLTQEELLEEAKETEQLNIESLKKFQQMEIEAKQKALRTSKRSVQGPYIQYRSLTMPLKQISHKKNLGSPNSDVKICVDDADDSKEDVANNVTDEDDDATVEESDEKLERTFITFSDFDTFRSNFPERKPRETQQKICPITRLPAKYFDPVTKLPYANLQAFRILREAYYSQLEVKGDKSDPEVAAWLEWRLKNKPSKPPILTQITRPPAAFSHLLANATPIRTAAAAASSASPATTAATMTPPALRHPTTTIVMTTPPAIIQTARTIVHQQPVQQQQQQQSIVLPARTTPLTQSPIPVAQLLQTSQASSLASPTLPTQPTSAAIQTVKIGGQATSVGLAPMPRAVAATLTQAQLQQLANSRGTTNLTTIQNVLRASGIAGGPRAHLITRPSMSTPTAIMRPQTVAGQVTLQQPQARSHTIALQRPGGQVTTQTIALQTAGVRAGTGQILVGGTTGPRQQIVVASSGGQARQIVMTTQGGGTPVRSGQILQVTPGGQQIVVSQSGLILNPQTKQQ